MNYKNLTGQKFGRLTVINKESRSKKREIIWQCLCDCGNLKNAIGYRLTKGYVQSCGCLRKDRAREANITHNKCYSRIYSIWKNMLSRCNNSNHDAFPDYGGRGIKVCERWLKFENFFADMGDPPEGLTIDRIDVNRNYEFYNCRWATWSEQNFNKRNSYKE